MEKTQSVRHQNSRAKNQAQMHQAKAQLIATRNLMVHVLLHHPWLFVILLFGAFVSSAAISLYSLGVVEDVKLPESTTIQVEVRQAPTNTTTAQTVDNPIPLWTVIAIALSCASGCIVLLRLLNRPSKPKKHQRHRIRHQQTLQTSRRSHKNNSGHQQTRKSTALLSKPKTSSNVPVIKVAQNFQPSVTAVPRQTIPLAPVRHESLADLLDVRRKRPVSVMSRE